MDVAVSELTTSEAVPLTGSLLDAVPLDVSQIPPSSLDLANRTRTNPFPWRGQFSPELAELLLSCYGHKGATVVDPYAGVGTTVVEAARLGLPALGVEINPAAVAMAETCMFIPQSPSHRRRVLDAAWTALDALTPEDTPLFRRRTEEEPVVESLIGLISQEKSDSPARNIFTNVLIRCLESPLPQNASALFRAFSQHQGIVLDLPHSQSDCRIVNADARALPIGPHSVDLVITSPPYINVFNYHQNNRRAMELLGWDLLCVARSEIGANRKHRGNRLLTVVQYCLDMGLALAELWRVAKPSGRVVLVIGRESNVRKTAFQNGAILGALALLAGFSLPFRQERKFVSRFGTLVYEDILHLVPKRTGGGCNAAEIRAIAVRHLDAARSNVDDEAILADLDDAVARADSVKPSPIYEAASARSGNVHVAP